MIRHTFQKCHSFFLIDDIDYRSCRVDPPSLTNIQNYTNLVAGIWRVDGHVGDLFLGFFHGVTTYEVGGVLAVVRIVGAGVAEAVGIVAVERGASATGVGSAVVEFCGAFSFTV